MDTSDAEFTYPPEHPARRKAERIDVRAMTLDAIQREQQANETARADEAAARSAEKRERLAAPGVERELAARACEELARDLGVTGPAFVVDALAAFEPVAPHVRVVWRQLAAVAYTTAPRVTDAVIEARHALASVAPFGPVRRDDRVFGGAEKRLRELPAIQTLTYRRDTWYVDWLERELPVTAPEMPDIAGEDEHHFSERVRKKRDAQLYDPSSIERNNEMARRELELLRDERRQRESEALASYTRMLDEQRVVLVRIVDAVLAKIDIGIAWWWARDFRRAIAGETPHIRPANAEPFKSWRMSQMLGVRFPLTKEQ